MLVFLSLAGGSFNIHSKINKINKDHLPKYGGKVLRTIKGPKVSRIWKSMDISSLFNMSWPELQIKDVVISRKSAKLNLTPSSTLQLVHHLSPSDDLSNDHKILVIYLIYSAKEPWNKMIRNLMLAAKYMYIIPERFKGWQVQLSELIQDHIISFPCIPSTRMFHVTNPHCLCSWCICLWKNSR